MRDVLALDTNLLHPSSQACLQERVVLLPGGQQPLGQLAEAGRQLGAEAVKAVHQARLRRRCGGLHCDGRGLSERTPSVGDPPQKLSVLNSIGSGHVHASGTQCKHGQGARAHLQPALPPAPPEARY